MKNLLKRYSHAWVFLYWAIYLPWFFWLEDHVTYGYYLIRSDLDGYIPFLEGFIVPYLLWFPFVGVVIAWFFFKDKAGFYRMIAYMFTGMTIFLVVCTLFPNGVALRPAVLPRDNLFTHMVQELWVVDTPTNVLPSLHVYNSVVCCVAVFRSEQLRRSKWVRPVTLMLTVSIVLATMFLKQHSVVDVTAALIMAAVLYVLIYEPVPQKRFHFAGDHV